MLGWSSDAPRVASRRKRSWRIVLAATSGGNTFTATMWPSVRWRARTTAPIPPTPARLSTSYRSPTARCTASRSGVCMGAGECTCACLWPQRARYSDAMAPVLCRVLGPVRVSIAGADAPPELLWRKHVALLVYLARSPRRSRTREHLTCLLWNDRDERPARHSLSEALRVLRRALGDEGVVADVDQVRLAPDAVTLDCDRFAELCERSEWTSAAGLVDGEFLEGLAIPEANDFENWLAAERALWRAQALEALVQGVAADLARGDAAAAARVGLRAVALDRTSEPAARAALRALSLAGDRAAALRVAAQLAHALHDMLGTAGSGETRPPVARGPGPRV